MNSTPEATPKSQVGGVKRKSKKQEKKRYFTERRKEENNFGTEKFTEKTILSNAYAADMIANLVHAYTQNLSLDSSDMKSLKIKLIKQTTMFFVWALNSFLQKVTNSVLDNVNSSKKKSTVDVSCQTDISGDVVPS